MIYGVRITDAGKSLRTLKSYSSDGLTIGTRRLVMLSIIPKQWLTMADLIHRVNEVELPEAIAIKFGSAYILSDSFIEDLLWLNKQSLIECARYKSANGTLAVEHERGMVFTGR